MLVGINFQEENIFLNLFFKQELKVPFFHIAKLR